MVITGKSLPIEISLEQCLRGMRDNWPRRKDRADDGAGSGQNSGQAAPTPFKMWFKPLLDTHINSLIAQLQRGSSEAKAELLLFLKSPGSSLAEVKTLLAILAATAEHNPHAQEFLAAAASTNMPQEVSLLVNAHYDPTLDLKPPTATM